MSTKPFVTVYLRTVDGTGSANERARKIGTLFMVSILSTILIGCTDPYFQDRKREDYKIRHIGNDLTDEVTFIFIKKDGTNERRVKTVKKNGRSIRDLLDSIDVESLFESPAQAQSSNSSAIFGDFNLDDRTDVAFLNFATDSVSIHMADSDGSFLAPVDFATGPGPRLIQVGDVNGDDFPEIIAASEDVFSILPNNGEGSFGEPVTIASLVLPTDLALGDFNEDGLGDLVFCGEGENVFGSAVVRLGNSNGTFQDEQALDIPEGALAVVVTRFNDDAYDDIISNGSILLGNGDGTFQSANRFSIGFASKFVQVGDLNHDGRLDIISANRDKTMSILLGNGDGTVLAPLDYTIGVHPEDIQVSDFNNDGFADVVISSVIGTDRLAVYYGRGDGTLNWMSAYPSVSDRSFRLGADDLTVAEFTGDEIPDIMVVNAVDAQGMVILPGVGNGTFGDRIEIPQQRGTRIVSGDWNDDDRVDLALITQGIDEPRIVTLIGDGEGGFTPTSEVNLAGSSNDARRGVLVAGAINEDNFPDLLIGQFSSGDVAVYLGNGDGTFSSETSIPVGNGLNSIAVGDINGDGTMDLAITHGGILGELNGGVIVTLGEGDGVFQAPVVIRQGVTPEEALFANFNGDQHLDLAVSLEVDSFDWDIEIYFGRGDGSFEEARPLGMGNTKIGAIVAMDADLDGKADLAVEVGDGRLITLRGFGDGTFAPVLEGAYGGGRLYTTDFDRDGWPDLVSASGSGFIGIARNPLSNFNIPLPLLKIVRTAEAIELRWPQVFRDWVLMESDRLIPPFEWNPVPHDALIEDNDVRVMAEQTDGSGYFRLERP